jgi:hypothetical protein
MSFNLPKPVPPQPGEEPIGDIEDMIPEGFSPLGDFDEEDDEDLSLDFVLDAHLDPEPILNAADSVVDPIPEDLGLDDTALEVVSTAPAIYVDSVDEELPSMDDGWGFAPEKMTVPEGEDTEGPDNENAVDFGCDLDLGGTEEADVDPAMTELSDEEAYALGLELCEEARDFEGRPFVDAPPTVLLDSTFLGPVEGRGFAGAFSGGKPVVVGEGMFVLAADELLHETSGAARLAVAEARSIFTSGRLIYVGTDYGGLFVTRDFGRTFELLNTWVGRGLASSDPKGLSNVPTSLRVLGQKYENGIRLLGLTGEGELLTTWEPEREWQGPFGLGRCLAVCPVYGTQEVLLIATKANGAPRLLATRDFEDIEERALPQGMELLVGREPVLIAASGSTVLMGVDSSNTSAVVSGDRGATWRALPNLGRPTALLVDADNPSFLAVASWREDHGMAALHISEDRGARFYTVLVTGEESDSSSGVKGENRIRDLSSHLGRIRRILAVTEAGSYLVALSTDESTH